MKKHCFCLLLLWLSYGAVGAAKFPYKYGDVTKEELEMAVYPSDTAATAAYLYEDGCVWYDYNRDHFQLCYERRARIKVFSSEGVSYGDISIPFYYFYSNKEQIVGLEAVAWNVENGKITRTKLSRQYIFDEKVNDHLYRRKFSVPAVKAGTVIEIKYRLLSDFYFNMPDWEFQHDIPVKYSRFETRIPEYFFYNRSMGGYLPVQTETVNEGTWFSVETGRGQLEKVQCACETNVYVVENVPAMRDEPYVWCNRDFISCIRYELKGVQFPFSTYKPYSREWKDIDELLKDNVGFGRKLHMSNPFKEEIKTITALPMDDKAKMQAIFRFIQQSFKWNGEHGLFENDIKETLKSRTGTNADINFILMAALKDAGFRTFPILMSRRTKGQLPLTYASVENLNTFVVGVELDENDIHFLDASDPYTDVDVLPVDYIVDRARRFAPESGGSEWINLCEILNKNTRNAVIQAHIDEDGVLSGFRKSSHTNQLAYQYKKEYYGYRDSAEYCESFEREYEVEIDSFAVSGLDAPGSRIQEYFTFKKPLEVAGDYIYFNPLVFPFLTKNPFAAPERQLPVEFDIPFTSKVSVIIDLPEGYKVEELPSAGSMAMQNGGSRSIYRIQQLSEQRMMVSYLFELKNILYPVIDYGMIRQYYGNIITQNTGQVVLKKVSL